jgi:biopolymer transport protein ExbD/biopolymer transport protein TolR
MRRFSQRHSLVTLSEINITPLLDLAFVLLIIFVITTPLLEQGLNLRLPAGDTPDNRKVDKSDIRVIEISPNGQYMFGGKYISVDQLAAIIISDFRRNPRLMVDVRADENVPYKHVMAIVDRLANVGIEQYSLRTHPKR